ncbi:alkyl sulfatase C-terminal domain-containing protein, partial [Arthrospira platensis SPKY1]|nr:alkyl sulfatase C-terminal domain-containing protein [Arthrospira platensis SPKY1]
LSGALELRKGVRAPTQNADKTGILRQIPMSHFLTAIATLLNGPKADGKHIVANFHFTDIDEQHVVWLENAVLHHRQDAPQANADFTVKLTRGFWLRLLNKE